MSEPLWSDTRIEAELRRIGDNMRLYIADAATVAEQVRDDYEASIAELEAQLAQRWQPLPDGSYDDFTLINDGRAVVIFINQDWGDETFHLEPDIRLCRLVTQEQTPAIPPAIKDNIGLCAAAVVLAYYRKTHDHILQDNETLNAAINVERWLGRR